MFRMEIRYWTRTPEGWRREMPDGTFVGPTFPLLWQCWEHWIER